MASTDLYNQVVTEIALKTQDITTNTTTAGEIIDTSGYESVVFVAQTGTLTDGFYLGYLTESDDATMTDATMVDVNFRQGSMGIFNSFDDTTFRMGYLGHKRYVRLSFLSTSVSTGGTLSAIVVKNSPRLVSGS